MSLDLLRGLIMVLMAIDHASYFVAKVHPGEFWGIPLPTYDSAAGFLTRLVTHLAAPGFFLLMGASIVFLTNTRRRSGWSDSRIARYLITRGALLILLQHLVENPAWLIGTLGGHQPAPMVPGGGSEVMLHFGVLYGLGASMIASAAFLRAPAGAMLGFGTAAILLSQYLTPGPEQTTILFSPAWRLFAIPGHSNAWQVFYPFLPWFGVTLLGMAFGRLMRADPRRAVRTGALAGIGLLAGFVLIRMSGGFGNIHPVTGPGWINFLNVTKYPPSLAFLLLTLGSNLLLLAAIDTVRDRVRSQQFPLLVFGQTALGFYLAHLYLFAAIGLFFPAGTGRPVMYLIWLLGLALLYPICLWYRSVKQSKPADSLWKML